VRSGKLVEWDETVWESLQCANQTSNTARVSTKHWQKLGILHA